MSFQRRPSTQSRKAARRTRSNRICARAPAREKDGSGKGYVYVLTNSAMPGLVKIGFTTWTPRVRARELSSASGAPASFNVRFCLAVPDALEIERGVHSESSKYRANRHREFFRMLVRHTKDSIVRTANCGKHARGFFLFFVYTCLLAVVTAILSPLSCNLVRT